MESHPTAFLAKLAADCLVNYGDSTSPGTICPPGVGNLITPELLEEAKGKWEAEFAHYPQPRIGVMVGGDVERCYEEKHMPSGDMEKLGKILARQLDEHGGSLLITTSRRTPPKAVAALRKTIANRKNVFLYDPCESADENGVSENPIHGIMACADVLVSTADSMSMVSEVCATGKPVYIQSVESTPGASREALERLFSGGHARRLGERIDDWTPTPIDITKMIADAITARMQQKSKKSALTV